MQADNDNKTLAQSIRDDIPNWRTLGDILTEAFGEKPLTKGENRHDDTSNPTSNPTR